MLLQGSAAALYAGEHSERRVTGDSSFKNGDIRAALKHGFLGLDEDMLAGMKRNFIIIALYSMVLCRLENVGHVCRCDCGGDCGY